MASIPDKFKRSKTCLMALIIISLTWKQNLGNVILVESFPWVNVNLDIEASDVNQDNLTWCFRLIERDNIVGQAQWCSIMSTTQLPVIYRHKAGDSPAEAAKGDTIIGELD